MSLSFFVYAGCCARRAAIYLVAHCCCKSYDAVLSGAAVVFQLCLFNSTPPQQHALGFMHKHELAFQLSPHITNLNLNEPPLQIHQQAMTLNPPPSNSSPTPYSTPLPPATHIHQQAIISRHPLTLHPPTTTISSSAHIRTPFLPQPHQLHSAHLIKGGEDREKEKWWGITFSQMVIIGFVAIKSRFLFIVTI